MIRTSPSIRAIALEHFKGRYAAAQKQARDMGESWPGDPANENLRLWLAIALAAGVGRDLPREVCAAIEVKCLFPVGARYLPTADRIAREHAWKGELARARDVALAKSEQRPRNIRAEQRARDLVILADALGAPPIDWSRAAQAGVPDADMAQKWGIAA
ncbi:hypothetical protein ACLBKU_11890 [Erythrobacter sp. NE805]|uniref:hypothetical protein n=1 Tax=Erythrobacter sp. NE805 TaxID=3389875 RepID=UPI00396B2A91